MSRTVGFYVLAVAISLVAGNDYVPADYVENINKLEAMASRIVSGWEARAGQHPHHAALRMINALGSVSSCGGSVVARQWVITSAHCTATRITIVVRAGLISLAQPEAVVESSVYYNYPTFDSSRPGVVQPDDIALVSLPIKLDYSRNLRPIRIQSSADAHRNYDGQVVYASGFGRTWTNGATTEHLRWTYLRAVSNPACAQVFGSRIITANTMCARYYNVTSQSVCQGDSGGPLVHVDALGAPRLVGVSSFVAGEPFGCHSGLPSGFARPGPFHNWYKEVTEIDFENLNEEDDTTTTTTTSTTPTTNTALPNTTTTTPNITITTPTISTPNMTATTPTIPTPNITTPNMTLTTPNMTATTPTIPTPNITTPNMTLTTPNMTATTPTIPTPNITTPNMTLTTPTIPTPNITTPNMTLTTPNMTATTPTIPTPNITTPNMTLTTPNMTLTTPNMTFTTRNMTATTPNMTATTPTISTPNSTFPTSTFPTMTTANMTFSTTTPTPPTTTPTPDGDDEEEDDPELSELLKRLEVKVGVVVRLTKRGRNNKEVLVQ